MHRVRFVVPVLLALGAGMGPQVATAQVTIGVSVTVPPPMLPVYEQPPIPGEGYMWVPGYWAYGPDYGYYWVPGTWVQPPDPGLLWTPAYWAWINGAYVFMPGYWGPQVGFYGGIDYGYGYNGVGYLGGYWSHGFFFYNRSVNNFGHERLGHVYERAVPNRMTVGRVSFNGGHGGTMARPTPQQQAFEHQHHVALTSPQVQHQQAAAGNHALWDSVNHGRPPIAATARPGAFTTGVVPARNAARPAAAGPANAGTHNGAPALRPPGGAAPPPISHGAEQPRPGPAPQAHEAPRPQPAPAPQNHAEPARPAPAPQNHAEPARPAPAPQTHEAPRPQAAPAPQNHAEPARPAPAPQYHEAPHPQPAPAPRPQPAPRAEPARPAPAPQSHEAPRQGPAPAQHDEHKPPPG